MSEPAGLPALLREVVQQLRRRHVQLGVDDLAALRLALAAGFGWSSDEEFRELCVRLWASSPAEAEAVRAAFARADLPQWETGAAQHPTGTPSSERDAGGPVAAPARPAPTVPPTPLVTRPAPGLPPLPRTPVPTDRRLILQPQFPLAAREVAQAWRRLRRPVRTGPATELDLEATVRERSRLGVASPPVLVPRRRNTMRLLLLVDRFGSMAPYDAFVADVCAAIVSAGRLDDVRRCWFHNSPTAPPDPGLLDGLLDAVDPRLDAVLADIPPARDGLLYTDPHLTEGLPLADVLDDLTPTTAVVVVSDAGAARRHYSAERLLEHLALAKGLRAGGATLAWLNPVPEARWPGSTAGQLARHVPVFPLDKAGMDRAVSALRGHPQPLERPL